MSRSLVFAATVLLGSIRSQEVERPPWTWTPTARMAEARYDSCAVRLDDGRVIIAGGTGAEGDLKTIEMYLPEGAFS